MGKKENLSDMFIDRFYTDKNEHDQFVNQVGTVLTFDYEGSKTHIKITKIDRKNKKCWGEHIQLYDFNSGMTHYGHDIDTSDTSRIYCRDCNVEIDQSATEEGEVKALLRQKEMDAIDEQEQAKRDKKRRFRYELLKTDGTIKRFSAQRRKKVAEIRKILDANIVGVVPPVYYPQKYHQVAIYSEQDPNWATEPKKNPHLLELDGDPDLGEPEKFYIVGDVLAEIEVL